MEPVSFEAQGHNMRVEKGYALRNLLQELARDFHDVKEAQDALARGEPGAGDRLDNRVKLLEQTFCELIERHVK